MADDKELPVQSREDRHAAAKKIKEEKKAFFVRGGLLFAFRRFIVSPGHCTKRSF